MNLSRLVAYNTLVQLLSKAVTVIFGITTTALLTNYLGSSGFGDYIFALSYVAIFSGIADWGTTLISVREASRHEESQDQIFVNALILRFVLSFLAAVLAIAVIFVLPMTTVNPKSLQQLIIFSSSLIVLLNLKTSLGIIFQIKLKLDRGALVDLVASLLTLGLTFLVISHGGSLIFLMSAIILANLFAIILAIFLARKLTGFHLSLSWPLFWQIGLESLPMGGVLVLFSVYNRLDTLILQALKGSSEVGIYGLSYRIYEVLVLGAFYLTNSLFPILAKEKDQVYFKKIYQKTVDILIMGGLLVFLGTLIFAPLAIKVITIKKTAEFSQSIPLLQILGLSCFFSYLNHLTGSAIIVLGKQKKYLLISSGALLFNLIANLLLIPRYSFYAAAWITVATEGLVFCLTSLMVYRQTKIIPNFLTFPKTAREIVVKRGKIF